MMFAYFKNVLSDLAKKSLSLKHDPRREHCPKSKASVSTHVNPIYGSDQKTIIIEFSLNSFGIHHNPGSPLPIATEVHDGSVRRIHEATWIDHKIALERACSDSCDSSQGSRGHPIPNNRSAQSSQTPLRLVSTAQV